MPNPTVNNIPPNTGRILDEYGGTFNIANFLESICSTGYETGASSPSTNVSALTGIVNFNISADADAVNGNVHNVVVNVAGLTTGLLIAAAVQSAIQRVGGVTYAGITFAYVGGVYVTTSGAVGPGSKIRITAGTATSGYSDLAAALKVGAANGAVDTDGKISGLPVAISGSIAVKGALTDRSGTITTGGAAQQLAAANSNRNYFLIQNPSAATESLWFRFGTGAVVGEPSIELTPGNGFVMDGNYVETELISVIAATTGHTFTAKEG
jgi:hypothetical protein